VSDLIIANSDNTNLITMDAELFKQIKILAAQLNSDQNNLLEEAAQDLIEKGGGPKKLYFLRLLLMSAPFALC
jgi:translation elongation factor P/translation initiation factor 5A